MKKIKLFALAAFAMLSTNAFAAVEEASIGIWKISYDPTATPLEGTIVGFKNDITAAEVKDLVIPATLDDTERGKTGIKIIALGDGTNALSSKVLNKIETLDAATNAANLATIAKNAFKDATALKSVKVGAKVASIGESAFSGCIALATVDLSAAAELKILGDFAFGNAPFTSINFSTCPKLQYFNATGASGGTNTQPFVATATGTNSYLQTVVLNTTAATNTTEIGIAFKGMQVLSTIDLSATGITKIEDGAFAGDVSLTSLSLPKTVQTIGGEPFGGCVRLATLTIDGESITQIGDGTKNLFGASTSALKTLTISLGTGKSFAGTIKAKAFGDAITTVSIAAGETFNGTIEANAITVAEDAAITFGKISKAPTAAAISNADGGVTVTLGEIDADLSGLTAGIVAGNIAQITVGKLSNKLGGAALGLPAKIVFAGEIATALDNTNTLTNANLTEIDFGTVKMVGADAVPSGIFNNTLCANLVAVSWLPADDDVTAATKYFNQAAFGTATTTTPKVTLTTTTKVGDIYSFAEAQLFNVIFGAEAESSEITVANGVSGAKTFYGKFNGTTKYKIAKKNGEATVTCYEGYVDASDATIYMLPMQIIKGAYYIPANDCVIVKSTSTDKVPAEKCNATEIADTDLDGANYYTAAGSKKNKIYSTGAAEKVGAAVMIDLSLKYYAMAKPEKYGLEWKTFGTGTRLPANTFIIEAPATTSADRLNVVWLDESDATAIQGFKAKVEAGQIYNLRGEKVNASYKGIVIKDGKKYIQK